MTTAHTAKHRRADRLDLAPLHADAQRQAKATRMVATPTRVSPEGWRFYTGTAAFGDITQAYPELVPPRVEFRPWDEVKASAKSLRGVPIVGTSYASATGHPGSDIAPPGRLLTADDVKPHLEGAVLDAWPDDATKSIRFEIVVYTAGLATDIDDGTVQISLGYDPQEDDTPGVFEGQRYDVVQRRIEYNAASVVDRARAERPTGEVARLDRAPASPAASEATEKPMKTKTKPTPKVDADPSAPANMMPLSAAAMALVDQMPGADKTMIMEGLAAMAGEAAEETAVEGANKSPKPPVGPIDSPAATPLLDADPATPAANLDSPPPAAGSAMTMDAATVTKMIADSEARVMDAIGKMSAAPKPPPGAGGAGGPGGGGRSDAAAGAGAGAPTHIDAAAVIAQAKAEAEKAGAKAGHAAHEAAGALVRQVRMDGHSDIHTAEGAAARMLATVTTHLPLLAEDAKSHLKAGRMDAFGGLYKQAAALKNADDNRMSDDMRRVVLGNVGGLDANDAHAGRLDGAGGPTFTFTPAYPDRPDLAD